MLWIVTSDDMKPIVERLNELSERVEEIVNVMNRAAGAAEQEPINEDVPPEPPAAEPEPEPPKPKKLKKKLRFGGG